MIAPPSVLQGAAGATPPKNQGNREARRTEGGAIMFKSFYFFLVSYAERGVAFSAEGFLYVIVFIKQCKKYHQIQNKKIRFNFIKNEQKNYYERTKQVQILSINFPFWSE